MVCSYWLLVPFALWCGFPVQCQGHELCYEDSWRYYGRHYSCFKRISTPLTWTAARDYCLQMQLGSSFGVTTRLAKIDDGPTNSFVRGLCAQPYSPCWIGISYNDEEGDFRWDYYSDEKPKFRATNWPDPQGPYVAINNTGWNGYGYNQAYHFVCQHDAKRINDATCEDEVVSNGLRVTCTSEESPIQAACQWTHKYEGDAAFLKWEPVEGPRHASQAEGTSFTTACSGTLHNVDPRTVTVKMKMYPDPTVGPDLSDKQIALTVGSITIEIVVPEKPVFSISPNRSIEQPNFILVEGTSIGLTCSFNTGSPGVYSTKLSCESPIMDKNNAEVREQQANYVSTTFGPAKRDMHGRGCVCWGNHVTGDTESTTLTFEVVTKPTTVACESKLTPTGFQMSCHIEKVYPQAMAVWAYRYQNDDFNSTSSTGCSHDSYADIDGFQYYTSNCSVTLTPDTMTFRPGNLTVQVTLYPDEIGIDEETTGEAFITRQETVNIVPPDRPVFKLLDQTLQISSPIHFSEDDRIYLTCEVPSGNPSVQSVTLACAFPFNNSNTTTGNAYVMDETASRDMNGKNCTCIGYHLTGHIQSSPLTFNVTYVAEVKHFTVNGQTSLLVVDLDESLALSCLADGNPLPSVNIRKLGTSYVDTSDWLSSSGKLEKEIQAQCDHNGRYRCSAQISEQDHQANDSVDVDVRVRCQPTYCNETSRDLELDVKPGKPGTVSLCVVAYPMPLFRMLKYSKTGWQVSEDLNSHTTHVTSYHSQQIVTIDLANADPTNLGKYALEYYVGNNTYTSLLYFNLTAPLTHCNGLEDVVYEIQPGQSASVNMCVTAFPSPSHLVVRKVIAGNEISQANSTGVKVDMQKNGDILTSVRVTFSNFKATHLGQYRLFDSQDTSGSTSSYLTFSLAVHIPEAESEGSSGNAGAIAGAVVSVVIVIVIVVIVVICILRRKKKRDEQKESANESGAKQKIEKYGCDDYAKVDFSMKRKGTSDNASKGQRSENVNQIYDNDGFVFQHRTSKDYEDEPYSNMPVPTNTPDILVPELKSEKGDGDLVYVDVDFSLATDNKAKPQTKSKLQKKPKRAKEDGGEGGEATEYAEINQSATMRIRKEKEEEENDKMEGKGDGKENSVYANMPDGDNVP